MNDEIGVLVGEKPDQVVQAITGEPTAVSGMVVRTGRGPAGARRVLSYEAFERMYGAPLGDSHSHDSVEAFFTVLGRVDGVGNPSGAELWAARVLGTGGGSNAAAAVTLSTESGGAATSASINGADFPVRIPDGATLGVAVDGGAATTVTVRAKPCTYTGVGATYAAVTAGHALNYTLAGVTRSVAFVGTENDQAEFLATLNEYLVAAKAINVGGQVRIVSDQQGSGAVGQILASSASDVLASLGFTSGAAFTNAGPNNVADANMVGVTAAELVALCAGISGLTRASTATTAALSSGTTGLASSVQLSGTVPSYVTGFDTALHSGADAGSSIPAAVFTDVGPGDEGNYLYVITDNVDTYLGGLASAVAAGSGVTAFQLSAAAAGQVKVGDTLRIHDTVTLADVRGYVLRVDNRVVTLQSGVTVGSGGLTTATSRVVKETFDWSLYYRGQRLRRVTDLRMSPLSPWYFVGRINTGEDEQQVVATDPGSPITTDNRPVTSETGTYFTGGSTASTFLDADYIGSSVSPKTGLFAFDVVSTVRRLSVPGVSGTNGAVAEALTTYCGARMDVRAVLSTPEGLSEAEAVTYRLNTLPNTSYASIYGPWVKKTNKLTGQLRLVPPEGYVMGMNARVNNNRGIAKAPGGYVDGRLPGARGVEYALEGDALKSFVRNSINPIVMHEGLPTVILARTLYMGGSEAQIHVRDTLIYLRVSIQRGTQFVYLEPNTKDTRGRNKEVIDNFLEKEWKKGTLEGATKADAFATVCDESNNPLDVVNADEMRTKVSVRIPRTVERSYADIINKTGSASS